MSSRDKQNSLLYLPKQWRADMTLKLIYQNKHTFWSDRTFTFLMCRHNAESKWIKLYKPQHLLNSKKPVGLLITNRQKLLVKLDKKDKLKQRVNTKGNIPDVLCIKMTHLLLRVKNADIQIWTFPKAIYLKIRLMNLVI